MLTPRRSFISTGLESRACDRAASGLVCVHVRLTAAFRSRERETNQSLRLAKRSRMLVFDAQQLADSFPPLPLKKSFDRRAAPRGSANVSERRDSIIC